MITREQTRAIKDMYAQAIEPVLSLYIDQSKGSDDNSISAIRLRVRHVLEEFSVPKEIGDKVLPMLDVPQKGRTRVIIAGKDFVDEWNIQASLPLTGGIEAEYGKLYLTPLLYAVSEFDRFGIVAISGDKARLFEVYLGEIEELEGAFQPIDTDEWKDLSADNTGLRYGGAGVARGGGGVDSDHLDQRMEAWHARFFKRIALELEDWVEVRGLSKLVLVGDRKDTDELSNNLTRPLREMVTEKLGGPTPKVSPGALLTAVEPGIERYEAQREAEVLDRLEEKGVFGEDEVLRLLQQGNLQSVVIPWNSETNVYFDEIGEWKLSPHLSPTLSDRPTESIKRILPELAASMGTQVVFVRDGAESRLIRAGGLAGSTRY